MKNKILTSILLLSIYQNSYTMMGHSEDGTTDMEPSANVMTDETENTKLEDEETYKKNNPENLSKVFLLNNDLNAIKAYIDTHNIDINSNENTEYPYNILTVAIYKHFNSLVKKALALGANPNISNDERYPLDTPLIIASKIEDQFSTFEPGTSKDSIIMLLVDAGADVNASDANGDTPLLHILKTGFYIPEYHLKENNYSIPDPWISFENYKKVIQELIDHGADLTHVNNEGLTAQTALKKYFYQVIKGKDDHRVTEFYKEIEALVNPVGIYNEKGELLAPEYD